MISSQVLRPDPTSHVSGHRVAVVVAMVVAVVVALVVALVVVVLPQSHLWNRQANVHGKVE